MQIVNKSDKIVTFAKVEIEPKNSVTIHDSFITKADLKQEGVKVVNRKLVYIGYKEEDEQGNNDNKDNKLLGNGGNDSDPNSNDDTSKELEDETIAVEELSYKELKAKVEELGLEVENNKKVTLQKALQNYLNNKDKED